MPTMGRTTRPYLMICSALRKAGRTAGAAGLSAGAARPEPQLAPQEGAAAKPCQAAPCWEERGHSRGQQQRSRRQIGMSCMVAGPPPLRPPTHPPHQHRTVRSGCGGCVRSFQTHPFATLVAILPPWFVPRCPPTSCLCLTLSSTLLSTSMPAGPPPRDPHTCTPHVTGPPPSPALHDVHPFSSPFC